jgi:hypothetical protein
MAFYFKRKYAYINGTTAQTYLYVKLDDDGRIVTVTEKKGTLRVSNVQSITLQKGFEVITEEEFNQIAKSVIE